MNKYRTVNYIRKNKSLIMGNNTLLVILLLLILPYNLFSQGNGLYEFIGRNGKYGFMDKTGKVVIPAKYIYVHEFSEGLAFVTEKQDSLGYHSWICIDTLGSEQFIVRKKCKLEESFSEGLAVIKDWDTDKYWFIDITGKKVFNKEFGDACRFTNGYARVSDKKYGKDPYFIDKEGEKAKHLPEYGSIFQNGISYCGYKLIDTLGNVLIDSIDEWTGADDEYLKVRRKDKWGFIDRKGNIIIDFQYEEDRSRWFDKFLKLNTDSLDAIPKARFRNVGYFSEGLASLQIDSLYGFINLKNEIVIEPIFKGVSYFSEGLAGATLDGKTWGFINKEGKFEIEPQYFYVDAFENGACGVNLIATGFYIGDYYFNAIINKKNEILFKGEMHSYMGFTGELIQYYEGGDFGGEIHYLDKNGKPIIPQE
ncbi:MAG: WG repeat-containing protein [Bacteroidales bacterium]|nr:WG repeat-containing protein [Bacteroidales bacterium]